jgi:hypothetical protein
MRAIIDWSDQDTVLFGSTAIEDYRYNTGKDPYEAKNHYYDTLEELRLVKGIDEDFMSAFNNVFTVYGGCQVNVNLADAPLLVGLVIQHAASPNDPALQWQNLSLLARYLIHIRDMMGGFADLKAFIRAVESPTSEASLVSILDPSAASNQEFNLPPVNGVKLNEKTLQEAIVVGGARRTWEITATSEVGRIKKKIKAVWDTKYVSMQTSKYNLGPGGFLYWREE